MVELAARMQHGHHDLGSAHPAILHDVDGDTPAIILDRAAPICTQCHVDPIAMAGQVLVDGVVDAFPHQVMQRRAVVNVPDVHAGPFAHRLESLEYGDIFGPVGV
jgi:hypothetical protein